MGAVAAEIVRSPSLSLEQLLERTDLFRVEATKKLDPERRSEFGQFLTPSSVARFMATFFNGFGDHVRVLEPGAGAGVLLAAVVAEACGRPHPPKSIQASAFEVDPLLARYLRETLALCPAACREAGVHFSADLVEGDFIASGVELLDEGLFALKRKARFTHAILNPPYKKLNSDSNVRLLIRRAGIETSNLYSAFVALTVQLLEPGGEMVAITPRSFCNGPYFRPFREMLLRETAIEHVHLFDSRTAAFASDDVLQENVIVHIVKGRPQAAVIVSSSGGPGDDMRSIREVPFAQIVRPEDAERFLHIAPSDPDQQIADAFALLPSTLAELGVSVSTGKVVDFRAKPFLRQEAGRNTQPLIYATHFASGVVRWPKAGKKPNALVDEPGTSDLWMPRGTYVLVKRFSSKEERRRIVSAVFDPEIVSAEKIGFENHLNVFHACGEGLDRETARGLAAFLNSTFVDAYFRQISGHTQVNATDLRSLRYPTRATLTKIGKSVGDAALSQRTLDELVEGVLGFSSMEVALSKKRKVDTLSTWVTRVTSSRSSTRWP